MQTIIHTPTNQIDHSIDFYTRLGFSDISQHNKKLFSDGQVIIEINSDRFARAGVKLIKKDWSIQVKALDNDVPIIKMEYGYLLSDWTGISIYLIDNDGNSLFDISELDRSIIGNFAGLSLETISIAHTQKIWEALGFSQSMGSADQGWLSLSHRNGFGVSLMKPISCPHLFFNPSLTYFNGKDNNPKIIEEIREREIPIAEEITYFNKEGIVDNVILKDPGGYGIFVFND